MPGFWQESDGTFCGTLNIFSNIGDPDPGVNSLGPPTRSRPIGSLHFGVSLVYIGPQCKPAPWGGIRVGFMKLGVQNNP